MATHSTILAWRIPWTEEPGGLQSMGSQRVGHSWAHTRAHPTMRQRAWNNVEGQWSTDGKETNGVELSCNRISTWFLSFFPFLVANIYLESHMPNTVVGRILVWPQEHWWAPCKTGASIRPTSRMRRLRRQAGPLPRSQQARLMQSQALPFAFGCSSWRSRPCSSTMHLFFTPSL